MTYFNCIQSLDRLSLAHEIDRQAEKAGVVMPVLVQVNIGCEPNKGGVLEADLMPLLDEAASLKHVAIEGLMCVPPMAEDAELTRPYFARMREWFERLSSLSYPNMHMKTLSMGMTHDFEVAIEEGATMVRVGSGIFGER